MYKDKRIIFITEGGLKIGLGHVMRCIAVAEYIRDLKRKPFFIVNNSKAVADILKKRNFHFNKVFEIARAFIQYKSLVQNKPVLIDSKRDVSNLIRGLQKNGCKVTLVDNTTNARLYADNAIYPFEHFNLQTLDWSKANGKVYYGAKYFPLRKELRVFKRDDLNVRNEILVSFGSVDPNGLTLKVLKALKNMNKRLNIKVLIGPVFKKSHIDKIYNLARDSRHKVYIIDNNFNLKSLLKNINFCIAALGISIYEFNYFCIPVVLLCNYKRDIKDAEILKRLNIASSLGYYKDINLSELAEGITGVVDNGDMKIKKYVDGKGAKRIASLLLRSYEKSLW